MSEEYEIPESEEERDSLVEIDEYNLDKEFYEQPKLMRRYAFKVADLRLIVAERKAAVDLVKAELELAIRAEPENYGVKKVTEKLVEAVIITQDEYKTALKKYNRAKHKLDQYQAIVSALEHRKSALEGAVKLHGQGYFAEPREPEGKPMTEANKRRVRTMGKKRKQ